MVDLRCPVCRNEFKTEKVKKHKAVFGRVEIPHYVECPHCGSIIDPVGGWHGGPFAIEIRRKETK